MQSNRKDQKTTLCSMKDSMHVLYDIKNQRFLLVSSKEILPVEEAFVWRNKEANRDRFMISGDHVKVDGGKLEINLPFSILKPVVKWGKILVRGKTWKVHLTLVETSLKDARTCTGDIGSGLAPQRGAGGSAHKLEAQTEC
jgi:hypothetical protein